ncbi:Polynucleotidyl transferase ribonuclease H-like superfamily protein [Euphorbia peplus]|nr:Polynucleotidyl transferase ribonuclease H-like superfamily protein [Euphorbia peplus]
MFLWVAAHNKLMGNAERKKRGSTQLDTCDICKLETESTLHILRDCPHASQVWNYFVPNNMFAYWSSLNLQDWLMYNINGMKHPEFHDKWETLFPTIIWWLWRWRCNMIFQGEERRLQDKLEFLKNTHKMEIEAFHKDSQNNTVSQENSIIMIRWAPPENNWFKLNSDGCSKGNPGLAGAGGVIRDNKSKWIFGFMFNIGNCSAVQSELWGILKGLMLAWDVGIKHLIVESDSDQAVTWLSNKDKTDGLCSNLIGACLDIISKDWEVWIVHVYREANRVADKLANNALNEPRGFHIIKECPLWAINELWQDTSRMSWPRSVGCS